MAKVFEEGSLGARYLKELKDTQTLKAFESAGEKKFQTYYKNAPYPIDGEIQDQFFRSILGDALADEIISANDIVYGPKIPLHNYYIAWARSVFDVEPKW